MTGDGETPQEESPPDGAVSTIAAGVLGGRRAGLASADRHYLLVFESESSRMIALPATGEVVIGRGETADLRVTDSSVSRTHAKVTISGGQVRVADLGSQNGTRVNDEQITGSRTLASGDVITLSAVNLVLHLGNHGAPSPLFVDTATLRQRIDGELVRADQYFRPLSVVQVLLNQAHVDRPRAEQIVGEVGRRLDSASWCSADGFTLVLPELNEASATEHAHRVLEQLASFAPLSRAGLASCPTDGGDVDTLLSSAREAARTAAPGEVALARETFKTLSLGDARVVVADPVMLRLYGLIDRLANSTLTVLVCGETGAGKELAARALHYQSPRRDKRLLALNCAALQENLLESELFGHERGSFTGAVTAKQGLLEAATGGTVFLDEVGELSPAIQAKFLRAIETKRVTRVGDTREREIDVRIVAATNRNLEVEAREGRFRQDLFFRLCGSILWMPPLRERKRELPILARAFLADACERAERPPMEISDAAMQRLITYRWPGNVRELKNVMDYAAATVTDNLFESWHLDERLGGGGGGAPPSMLEPQAGPALGPQTSCGGVQPISRPPARVRVAPRSHPATRSLALCAAR